MLPRESKPGNPHQLLYRLIRPTQQYSNRPETFLSSRFEVLANVVEKYDLVCLNSFILT